MTLQFQPGAAEGATGRSARRLALDGARDITPMVIGVIPFALAIGAAIGASSLTKPQGLFSAPAILAGSAQLATVQMLDDGNAPLVIVVSALVINARILLYSASLATWFAEQSLARRMLVAVAVIDQMHFTCAPRFERGDLDGDDRVAYYAGAAAWLLSAWVGVQTAAILIGAQAPASLGLELAAPLALVGLLAKSATTRPTAVAAIVGFSLAVVGAGLPMHSSVLVASIGGIVAGRVVARHCGAVSLTAGSTP
jgi:predicted branched-subunit amino acid permease